MVRYVPSMAGAQDQIGQDQMDEMLSIGEAADFIGVSVDTLRRWSKKMRVTTYRSPGGHRYYKKKDLVNLFDAKYTRDEPTERSSNQTFAEKAQAEPPATTQPDTDTTSPGSDQEEFTNIPKMQPVQILSEEKTYEAVSIPDQMPPPFPMPVSHIQSPPQTEYSTDTQTRSSIQQSFRHPAGPINKTVSNQNQTHERPVDTVITDFTSGGGFQEERTVIQTSRPAQQDETSSQESPRTQYTSFPSDQPSHVTLQPPWRVPSPIEEESEQDIEDVDDEPDKSFDQAQDKQSEVTERTDQEEKLASEKFVEEKLTIDERSDLPTSEPTEERTETKEKIESPPPQEKVENETKEVVKADEEVPVERTNDERSERSRSKIGSETVSSEPIKAKLETTPAPVKEKSELPLSAQKKAVDDKSEIKQAVTPTPQEDKRSILEPEGIDVAKLNKLEKMDDESWFAKNKSNIMIGFTVFLLIDIILFVIWLTTSRILSPIP